MNISIMRIEMIVGEVGKFLLQAGRLAGHKMKIATDENHLINHLIHPTTSSLIITTQPIPLLPPSSIIIQQQHESKQHYRRRPTPKEQHKLLHERISTKQCHGIINKSTIEETT